MTIFRCWCCNAPLPDRTSNLHARHLASAPPDAGPSLPQDAHFISGHDAGEDEPMKFCSGFLLTSLGAVLMNVGATRAYHFNHLSPGVFAAAIRRSVGMCSHRATVGLTSISVGIHEMQSMRS